MNTSTIGAASATFESLFSIDIDIEVYASNWAYCDRLSSYAARMVSHNRIDSLLYSNLFSSALNELLETVFRAHGAGGSFVCSVSRMANTDRIELTIPCKKEQAQFYFDAVRRLSQPNVAEHYHSALFAEGALDPDIGLFELAVDYDASIRLEAPDENTVHLTVDLVLEEAQA